MWIINKLSYEFVRRIKVINIVNGAYLCKINYKKLVILGIVSTSDATDSGLAGEQITDN